MPSEDRGRQICDGSSALNAHSVGPLTGSRCVCVPALEFSFCVPLHAETCAYCLASLIFMTTATACRGGGA